MRAFCPEGAHFFELARNPFVPRTVLADVHTITARPDVADIKRAVGALAHPVGIPHRRDRVAVGIGCVKRELVAHILNFSAKPFQALLAADAFLYGKVRGGAPVVASVVPASRNDCSLVHTRIFYRLDKFLRHAEGHMHDDRQFRFLRKIRGFIHNRLCAMRLDSYDNRFAQIRQFGKIPHAVFDCPHRSAFELVFAVGFRHPVVVGIFALENVELDDNIVVRLEKLADGIERYPRENFILSVFDLHNRRIVEAVRFHVPPEHSAAALHPENRHKLARAEAYAVVLVELAVCAARENPVAVVALVCLGELGNDVDELRRVFDFRLRNHDAEFFVGKFFHFYGLGFDRFFAPQFGIRAYLRRFGEKPRRHNRRHQDRQNFFHSLSCV